MPDRLELTVASRSVDGKEVAVVRIRGEVDLASAAEMGSSISSEADAEKPLVIDLSGVPFMDSSGLRELLLVAEERGARLAVAVPPDSAVRHLIEIAEVAERLNLHASEEEALAAVAKDGST